MKTIDERFTEFLNDLFVVEELSEEVIKEIRWIFYVGFSAGCSMYEKGIDKLDELALKHEFKEYLDGIEKEKE